MQPRGGWPGPGRNPRECVVGTGVRTGLARAGTRPAPPLPRRSASSPPRLGAGPPPPLGPPPAAMPARRPPRAGAAPSTARPRPGRLLRNNGLQRSPSPRRPLFPPCRDRRWLGLRTAGALVLVGGGGRARR